MKRLFLFFVLVSLSLPIIAQADGQPIADGRYQTEVGLWHAYEEKESMGNAGLKSSADIVVENGNMIIYLQMQKLSVGEITTSLSRLFYADEENKVYRLADAYSFDLEIPGETLKRPTVFSMPLSGKKDYYPLLVDPKVAVMGTDPIKARLKVDWGKLKSISPDEEGPYRMAQASENLSQSKKALSLQNILIQDEQDISGEVHIQPLVRKNLESSGLKIEPLDWAKGYEISASGPVREIPFDQTTNVDQNAPAEYLGENATITFLGETDIHAVYYKDGEKFIEVAFEMTADGVKVDHARYGTYALVKKARSSAQEASQGENQPKLPAILSTQKPQPKPIRSQGTDMLPSEKDKENPENQPNDSTLGAKANPSQNLQQNIDTNPTTDDQTSEQKQSLQTSSTIPATEEHSGIIVLISTVYISLAIAGFYLWKRFLPHVLREIDRGRYLMQYEHNGGAGNAKN